MKRRTLAAAVAAATAVAVIPAAGAMAATAKRDSTTTLPNSATHNVKGLALKSAAPSSQQMSVTLQLPLRNQALADALINKGVVLSQAQYRAYFSPTQAQMNKVSSWAKKQGFSVAQSSRLSGQVTVRSNVSHVNKAFKVQMHHATLAGVSGLAVNKAPTVPTSLGLSGVAGLTTLQKARTNNAVKPNSKRTSPRVAKPSQQKAHTLSARTQQFLGLRRTHTTPNNARGTQCGVDYWGQTWAGGMPSAKVFKNESAPLCGYLPADLANLYSAKTANAKAPALGILLWGDDTSMKTETNKYMKEPDVKYPQMTKYHHTAATANAKMGNCEDGSMEQAIDVQSSHAIAPNSPIYYYGGASCYLDDMATEFQTAIDAHKVTTMSMSFGTSSDKGMTKSDMAMWDRPLKQAALTGISVFASTGDDGDNSYVTDDHQKHVGYPASSAYLTAVGGTSVGLTSKGTAAVQAGWAPRLYLQSNPSSKKYKDVTSQVAKVVVDPNTGATYGYPGAGGGVSDVSKRPSWQNNVVSYSGNKRAVPDIGGIADPYTGYTIRTGGDYITIGGTSLASPVVAAASGLAKAKSGVRLGNMAPKFYAKRNSSAIKDINDPNNAGLYYPTQSGEFNLIAFDAKPQSLQTKKGWDNVTGVGVPGGKAFYTAFK